MPKVARFVGIALIGGALAACTGAVTVHSTYVGSYEPSVLRYQATQGSMKTEIFGNPFSAPKTELDNVVTDTMSGSIFGRPVSFATAVSPQSRSPYRVVMIVNPAHAGAPNDICREVEHATAAGTEVVRIAAAFCAGDEILTSGTGSAGSVRAPTDPTFRHLVRQIALALFPLEDPTRDDHDRDPDFPDL